MVLNILAPKCLILTNYIRCNCKNSKCKWTGIESHVHQHNFIIAIDDSIIPFHKLVRMDGMFGALSGLLSLNSHPFFPLWEEKQFGASGWRLLSFLLEEEVLGNREGSVATSVMPQSFPLCALRGKFCFPEQLRRTGKSCCEVQTKCLYCGCVCSHAVKCHLCTGVDSRFT